MTNWPHIAKIGLITGVATLVMSIIAGVAGTSASSVDRGLTFRAILVTLTLALMAIVSVRQVRGDNIAEPLPLNTIYGLMLGWLINPLSWVGRSYLGQWFTRTDTLALAFDFLSWLIVSVMLAFAAVWASDRALTGARR